MSCMNSLVPSIVQFFARFASGTWMGTLHNLGNFIDDFFGDLVSVEMVLVTCSGLKTLSSLSKVPPPHLANPRSNFLFLLLDSPQLQPQVCHSQLSSSLCADGGI